MTSHETALFDGVHRRRDTYAGTCARLIKTKLTEKNTKGLAMYSFNVKNT